MEEHWGSRENHGGARQDAHLTDPPQGIQGEELNFACFELEVGCTIKTPKSSEVFTSSFVESVYAVGSTDCQGRRGRV